MNPTMTLRESSVEVSRKGQLVKVPALEVNGRVLTVTGRGIALASFYDEDWMEGEIGDPELYIRALKGRADLFTFKQRLPDVEPHFPYYHEWDSLAVIPITTYADWLDKRAKSDVKTAVKKSARLGLVTCEAEFTDSFVEGIVSIYNESEVRQGRDFWHYGKSHEEVKRENSTYFNRSTYVGAYFENELAGFIRFVAVDGAAKTMQVIGKRKFFDKKVTNALIAKAVEICVQKGYRYLVYGNFAQGDAHNSLTEFKKRNGFEEILLPQYYVPLNAKGKLAIRLKMHRGVRLANLLPGSVRRALIHARRLVRERRR